MTDPLVDGTDAVALVAELTRRGQTLASAESLTAGLFAATVAGVPGASAVLRGGVIVYATDLKDSLAGVAESTLAADGPVAPTTAAELAAGAIARCGADWGVGLTGVAGPDPQDGKPVGTVFVGIAGPDGVRVRELTLPGGRWEIRRAVVDAALSDLLGRVRSVASG
ncbi:CinA family protein [Rhodococcus triatomae]|nr:competence damage induced protein [Rhodococcus triatomae BKS 15-14]